MEERRLIRGKDGLLYDEDGHFVYTGMSPLHEDDSTEPHDDEGAEDDDPRAPESPNG